MNGNTVLWIYIVMLVAGGLMGFLKAGSKASLISSCAFAFPLTLAAAGVLNVPYLADGIIAFLLIFFGMRLAKGGKFMPAGLMVILSIAALMLRWLWSH